MVKNKNEKQNDLSRRQFLSVVAAALASPAQTKIPLDQVRTKAEWEKLRAQTLANMQLVMGELPRLKKEKVAVIELEKESLPAFTRTKIKYLAEADDWVMAYLLVPRKLKRPAPAMLCLHQTVKIGKAEPAG